MIIYLYNNVIRLYIHLLSRCTLKDIYRTDISRILILADRNSDSGILTRIILLQLGILFLGVILCIRIVKGFHYTLVYALPDRIIVNIIVIIIVYDTLDLRCLVKYVRIQQIAIIGYLGGTAGFAAECATEHT